MNNHLVWDEKYNIGVDIIDKEHQRLFKIINKLFVFGEEKGKSEWACQEGIKYFKEHAVKHFKDEENYMQSICYKEFELHKHIHDEFRENTLPALEQELKMTDYSPSAVNHFLGVCTGWLIGHTLTEDMAMAKEQSSRWSNRLSGKEHTAIEKNIIQLLYNMFHLESHIVSESYCGEKFGKGIYYHLVYNTGNDDKKWEVFLAFEEQLLVNTVGKIMGIKSNKLDNMLINATRYTAQQFVGRVMKYFSSAESYEMKEENLLTYEQFQRVFEKEKLQLSLLLDTGAGYFSYCVLAPHLLEDSSVKVMDTKQAVSKVERYFEEEQQKEEKEKLERQNKEKEKLERQREKNKKREKSVKKNAAMEEVEKYFMEKEVEEKASKPVKADTSKKKSKNYFTSQRVEEPLKPDEINSFMAQIEKYFSEKKSTSDESNMNDVMEEIEKYFINKKEQDKASINVTESLSEKKKKPKVLVVDDSLTIRQKIKELLSEDYEVLAARSALSAIRSIILDMPDLVLLDYEMPVCDGRHVLEMLRSEEEFADVPVIFLTSKTDQESVRKVIALKPEGYLSKYLKPADIKQKIDLYFEKRKSLLFYDI